MKAFSIFTNLAAVVLLGVSQLSFAATEQLPRQAESLNVEFESQSNSFLKDHHTNQWRVPKNVVGYEMLLSLQQIEGDVQNSQASRGVIIQRYSKRNRYQSEGIGDPKHVSQQGDYRFKRESRTSAIEYLKDEHSGQSAVTKYEFIRPNFGLFERRLVNSGIVIKGQFSLVSTQLPAEQHLAEESHNNLSVAVNILAAQSEQVPSGQYPERALVLQRYYDDGRYDAIGYGPQAIPHKGTYSYQKVSAHVAIEQTMQTTDYFTLPFVMVYFYETPTSGTWYQDFGDGLIRFSGIFSTFPTTK